MAFFWRIWIAVIAVNLIVLSIFVVLATVQFGNINAGLAADRLNVLANRTVAPFKAVAEIGLSLSTVRNARALLERSRQSDDAIVSIDVFDADGRILHSTMDTPAAGLLPEVQATRRASQGRPWHHETATGFLSGVEIASRSGGSAGGIMITYSNASNVARIRGVGAELGMGALMIFLVGSVLSAGILGLGLRPQIAMFETLEKTISDFERITWRSRGHDLLDGQKPAENELMQLLVGAEQNYRTAGDALDQAKEGAH